MSKKTICFVVLVLAAALTLGLSQPLLAKVLAPQLPPSQFRDLITHNKGNVVTTVANWGYVGGFSHTGRPSGEYPKNSGRNYLAEIKYWMGAITESGDTVVVNTDDDLMPIPSVVSGDETYGIRLSTDPETYEFDEFDTVGHEIGAPANGWEIWNPDKREWEYNSIWDPINEVYVDGGPIAQQESHFRMTDDALGSSQLGLEITHTVYQWNYIYNQDYMFIVLQITNTSEEDYHEFAFGLYCDFDVGGFNNDGGNGRLGDLVAFDEERNLAWTYDEDGYDPGWGADVVTGLMGTKYIETPDGIGMTAFRTGQWEYLPETDEGRFEMIDSELFEESLPPTDQYYLQCTRGINLEAGKTVRVVYALVAGPDEETFLKTADMAQLIYDNNFVGPEPPKEPFLKARPYDHAVKLWWNNDSENTPDRFSGEFDFKGYRLYRSEDFGLTWGPLAVNDDGSIGPGYQPIAEFEIEEQGDIIQHSFVDSNVINGFEYWYSLVAFDTGDEELALSSLATAFGTPGYEQNAISVIPRSLPAGYYPIEKTLTHTAENGGRVSDGNVIVAEFDETALTDDEYEVRFSEDPYFTYWHIINKTDGDTLLADQMDQTASEDAAVVTDGFLVLVEDAERVPSAFNQTQFATPGDTTLRLLGTPAIIGEVAGYPSGGGIHFRSTYEIRFTNEGSEGYWWWDDVTPVQLPFEVWNVTSGEQVIAEITDFAGNQEWTPLYEDGTSDGIVIVNIPYDGNPHPEGFPFHHCWYFGIDPEGMDRWGPGDVITITGAPVNGPDDVFAFKSSGIDAAVAKSELDDIKTVPNPYIVNAAWEHTEGERKLEFVNLPAECTIRIYTMAGDLVSTIEHSNNGGTASWDLLSVNAQGVAPGIYFYSVESEYGSKIGKFAVIK